MSSITDYAPVGILDDRDTLLTSLRTGDTAATLTPIDFGVLTSGRWVIDAQSVPGLFTIAYIPLLGSFAGLTVAMPNGAAKMATVLLVVMANDTGGYAVGARFGKHPMAPLISPKKTWEGLAGSVALATAVGIPLTVWWLGSSAWIGLALSLAVVAAATCGDLIESLIKRDVGIKDMSSFLPGHGGAMDRLDSILVAAPASWLLLYWLIPN